MAAFGANVYTEVYTDDNADKILQRKIDPRVIVTLHVVDVRLTCLINITYLLTYLV